MSTVTVPKNSCGTHDTSSRSTVFSVLRNLLDNACGIAQSHRRHRGLRTLVRRRRYLCDNRIESFGTRSFSAPPCQDPDSCGYADPCEDPDSHGYSALLPASLTRSPLCIDQDAVEERDVAESSGQKRSDGMRERALGLGTELRQERASAATLRAAFEKGMYI